MASSTSHWKPSRPRLLVSRRSFLKSTVGVAGRGVVRKFGSRGAALEADFVGDVLLDRIAGGGTFGSVVGVTKTAQEKRGLWSDMRRSVRLLKRWKPVITQSESGYSVRSKKGRNLGGPYKSRAQAIKRLRQVEYFKHHGE